VRLKVVYEHWDMQADIPFYVGMGDPSRASDRLNRSKIWKHLVLDMEESGFAYEVRIVACGLTKKEAHSLEKERIAMWSGMGIVLANKSKGGEGTSGYRYTPEQRARRSEQQRGKPQPKTSARMLGVPKKRSSVEKSAAKQRGVPKPKVSAALTGRKQPLDVVEKRAEKIRGRKYSAEHCDSISKSLLGREITWGDKISATLKGKPSANKGRPSKFKGVPRSSETVAKIKATKLANKLAKQLVDAGTSS
jgi:hypothetical protein